MSCSQQCGPSLEGAAHIRRFVRRRVKKEMLSEVISALVTQIYCEILSKLVCSVMMQMHLQTLCILKNGACEEMWKDCDWSETGYQHRHHMFTPGLECDEELSWYPDIVTAEPYKDKLDTFRQTRTNTPDKRLTNEVGTWQGVTLS